jgi:hypothetical protein
MSGIAASMTAGRAACWLLDVDIGGRMLRLSSRALAIGDLRYTAGLQLGDVALSADTVGVEIQVPGMDWALLLAQGAQFDRRPFVLRRWWDGMALEEALVVLRGRTQTPEYGSPASPDSLMLTLSRDLREVSAVHPPPSAGVDDTTWPDRDSTIVGAAYPWVIGYPGTDVLGIGGGAVAAGSPALLVDAVLGRLLVAGHRVEATAVQVFQPDINDSEQLAVAYTTDGLGREIAYVDLTAAATVTFTPGSAFYAGWANAGGGLIGRSGTAIRGLGDWLLYGGQRLARTAHDWGRIEAEAEALNRIKVDFCWNERLPWDDWVTRNVLQELPVVQVEGPRGVFYRYVDWTAGPTEVHAWLDADETRNGIPVRRASTIRQTDEAVENEITVEYAMHAPNGAFLDRVTLTAQPGYTTELVGVAGASRDDRVLPDLRCKLSQDVSAYGLRPVSRQLRISWDRATALLVARARAARAALPHFTAQYIGPADLLRLERYTWVRLQDTTPGAHFVGRMALVLDHTLAGDGRQVVTSLLIRTDPRDPRSAS